MFSLEFTGTVLTYNQIRWKVNSNIGLWENNQDIAIKMMAKTVKTWPITYNVCFPLHLSMEDTNYVQTWWSSDGLGNHVHPTTEKGG